MNKHKKLAFFVAPFLAILGWVAADLYVDNNAQEKRLFVLEQDLYCDVIGQKCILRSGDFKVNVYQEGQDTVVNSTFPLDTATLFMVDDNGQAAPFRLGMTKSPYYWRAQTNIEQQLAAHHSTQKMRLILTIKGGQYVAEFESKTL